MGTASGVSFLVTSVISGLLVGLAGMLYVLILAIAVTAVSIVHLAILRVPEEHVVASEDKPSRIDIRGTLPSSAPSRSVRAHRLRAINNFLGGVFMALLDAYSLSLVSVEVWGLLWGFSAPGFIISGLVIAKRGLGARPLRALLLATVAVWVIRSVFTLGSSIALTGGTFIFLCVIPYIRRGAGGAAESGAVRATGAGVRLRLDVELSAAPLRRFSSARSRSSSSSPS